jgi:hypothetical protein
MIKDIGNEIKKLKVQAGFHFSIDQAIAKVISDTNKLRAVIPIFEWVINSAFDQASMFWKHCAPHQGHGCKEQISQLYPSTFGSLQT